MLGYQPPRTRKTPPGAEPPGGRPSLGADTSLEQTSPRGRPPWDQAPPPPCGQTHACENITFATSLRTVKITLRFNYINLFSIFQENTRSGITVVKGASKETKYHLVLIAKDMNQETPNTQVHKINSLNQRSNVAFKSNTQVEFKSETYLHL